MLTKIKLQNFRSYSQLDLDLTSQTSVLVGPNGVGKTNTLESIYYGSLLHSFRAQDKELIKYDKEFFTIEFTINKDEIKIIYQTNQQPKKQFLFNKTKKPLKSVFGLMPVVLFEPSDTDLFSKDADRRRTLLNSLLMQTDNQYTQALITYQHLIKQRNSLLRRYKQQLITYAQLKDQLFIFDLQLSEPIQEIVQKREEIIGHLNENIDNHYESIAAQKATFQLSYQQNCFDPANIEKARADYVRGFTTHGPHRDDLTLTMNGHAFANTASRGEVRTLILALKQAEFMYLQQKLKNTPILLLDDVFSELDSKRQKNVLTAFSDAQIIITTTAIKKAKSNNFQYIDVEKL